MALVSRALGSGMMVHENRKGCEIRLRNSGAPATCGGSRRMGPLAPSPNP